MSRKKRKHAPATVLKFRPTLPTATTEDDPLEQVLTDPEVVKAATKLQRALARAMAVSIWRVVQEIADTKGGAQ
jgi:hypothetical protein